MKILSIETSCDETAAAVVENGRDVLSSVIASQVEEHKLYGGVVPEIASRRHAEAIVPVVKKALNDAEMTIEDIDAIAVTHAPGLIGALLVGVNFAKGLSLSSGKPLIPTHHLRSHIASNYISHKELKPPFLCLVVSGGHSHIVMVEDYTKMKVIGKTRDDAAGEAFDKAARTLGMPYPGGIEMDRIAELGDDSIFDFPRPVVRDAPYDFSFSGLKTAVINLIHNMEQRGEKIPKEDICASFRKAVVELLVSNFMKAAEDYNVKTLVVAGGVSANSLLRKRLSEESEKRGFKFFKPDKSVCTDNAAMVGAQGYYEYLSGNIADLSLNAVATLPIDYR
jgi:N6-L-threonylcarbamoyladenine synthase